MAVDVRHATKDDISTASYRPNFIQPEQPRNNHISYFKVRQVKVKVKVKLSLCLTKYHVMKTCLGGVEIHLHAFLSLVIDGGD